MPPDDLLFHHRDMGGCSTKGDRAKPQKRQSDLLQLRVGVEPRIARSAGSTSRQRSESARASSARLVPRILRAQLAPL